MALKKLLIIAFRDLGRNRRRSLFSMLAVGLGLALLIVMSGWIAGTLGDSLDNNIRLRTGHLQIQAASYEEAKMSLLWDDLLENSDQILAEVNSLNEVKAATAELWASGIINTIHEAFGLQIIGIDPTSAVHDPIRESLVKGEFPSADQRGVILIGKRLADNLGVTVGQKVYLTVGNPDGSADEGNFTVVGLYTTGVPNYDQSAVFMPLAQMQAFSGAGDRVSTIKVMLKNKDDANLVASKLSIPQTITKTWEEMNSLYLVTMQSAMGFYYLFYGIVMLVVAVIITNTMLMAVFERTREMGVLAALGMKRHQLLQLILLEALLLSLLGMLGGFILGSLGVAYLAKVGVPIGDMTSSVASGFALGSVLYGRFVPSEIFWLSSSMLVLILLACLYPASYAARLEPVKALHSL